MSQRLELAERVVNKALALGAEQASVAVSEGTDSSLVRRDGKVEQATEAISRGLSVSMMINGRWSSHATSDLRPEAIDAFLVRAVDATQYLEPDPERALPDPALCGRGTSDADLDTQDPAYAVHTADARAAQCEAIERALIGTQIPNLISQSTYVADGSSRSARVTSGGFSDETGGAWFAAGAEVAVTDGEKRPEGGAYYGSRYLSDLPSEQEIAADAAAQVAERIGSKAIDSGAYPMILLNRVAGRVLGVLGGPLSGASLHHKRSCLAGHLGQRIGSDKLTLIDDPTVPRGLGSRAWDGDTLVARPRTVVNAGVLEQYYINVYYGRKLGLAPTTGGRSNWVLPPGERSWQDLAAGLDRAILVTGFLGGNSNGVTGDFSFGIRGVLLENGVPTQSLSEMNVAGNVTRIFHQLAEVCSDPWPFSSVRSPTLLFEDVQFSGS